MLKKSEVKIILESNYFVCLSFCRVKNFKGTNILGSKMFEGKSFFITSSLGV